MRPRLQLIIPEHLEPRYSDDMLFAARVQAWLWGAFSGFGLGLLVMGILLEHLGRIRP